VADGISGVKREALATEQRSCRNTANNLRLNQNGFKGKEEAKGTSSASHPNFKGKRSSHPLRDPFQRELYTEMATTSSSLVNVADDAELRLVSVLSEKSDTLSVKDCEACISGGDADKLLQIITKDAAAMQAFLTMENADEATNCFALLVALVEKTGAKEATVRKLAESVTGSPSASEEAVTRKLCLLSVLYNMRVEKVDILTQMYLTAGSYPSVFLTEESTLGSLLVAPEDDNALAPSVPLLVAHLDKWGVSVATRRKIYEVIVSVLPDNRKQRFLLLLVESYGKDLDGPGLQAAKQATIGAIRDPIALFRQQRSLLGLPAIQALEKDEPPLWGLLKIFQEGKFSDYQAYVQKNASTLAKWDLDATTCEKNMRILSLCSLAAEHEEIPYQVIADTLAVASNTVEGQVIAAVNSGLLEAKMDQLAQKVMVERCVVRKFDIDEWKSLQKRLQTWRKNVGSILEALKQSQAATAP